MTTNRYTYRLMAHGTGCAGCQRAATKAVRVLNDVPNIPTYMVGDGFGCVARIDRVAR